MTGAFFGLLGVVLVILGATGTTDVKLGALSFNSTSVGIAAIFIGALTIILVVRRGLGSIDIAVRADAGGAPDARAQLWDLAERLEQDDEWSSAVQRGLWIPDLFQRIQHVVNDADGHAPPSVDLFDINALAPLHAGFEMFLELLRAGGRLRIAMLDPRGEAFARRSALEQDRVGRIAAEQIASFHIIADLITHLRREGETCDLAVRLTTPLPDSAIVLVNIDTPSGLVLANPYPTNEDRRGLAVPWYKYSQTDGALYQQYREKFRALWEAATPVTPRRDLSAPDAWPFTEQDS